MATKATKTSGVDYFECDRCGACCEQLIIEAELSDAIREPRIAKECDLLDGRGRLPLADAKFSIACGKSAPCPFASRDAAGLHTCGIYPTRPHECVVFQAGSEKCQRSRREVGLPELKPVRRPATLPFRLHVLARDEAGQ